MRSYLSLVLGGIQAMTNDLWSFRYLSKKWSFRYQLGDGWFDHIDEIWTWKSISRRGNAWTLLSSPFFECYGRRGI